MGVVMWWNHQLLFNFKWMYSILRRVLMQTNFTFTLKKSCLNCFLKKLRFNCFYCGLFENFTAWRHIIHNGDLFLVQVTSYTYQSLQGNKNHKLHLNMDIKSLIGQLKLPKLKLFCLRSHSSLAFQLENIFRTDKVNILSKYYRFLGYCTLEYQSTYDS